MKRSVGCGSLGMKDYAIFVIYAFEMNSIIFFAVSYWRISELNACQIIYNLSLWSKNEYNVENRKYTSSYSPVIVPPKNCKTSVVFNVNCSNISTIWDRIYFIQKIYMAYVFLILWELYGISYIVSMLTGLLYKYSVQYSR